VLSLIEKIVAELSEATFFKEFCFTGQTFAPSTGESKELADVLICLDSDLIVIQVKEREEGEKCDTEALNRWFEKKVIGKGSDQVADTIRFLKDHPDATVKNARGHEFKLAQLAAASRQNVIVFGSLDFPDENQRRKKLYHSSRSGPIHLIEAVSFSNLLRWTVTPAEMLEYLRFRQDYMEEHPEAHDRSEKWLFGRFIRTPKPEDADADQQQFDGEAVVDSLTDDIASVDLREFFDVLGEGFPNEEGLRHLLTECAYLPRSAMREVKRRIVKCQQRLDRPVPDTLYRTVNPHRSCVFVFGVMPPNQFARVHVGVANLTGLAKYLCRTDKGVGFFFTKLRDGRLATTPFFMEGPHRDMPEMDIIVQQYDPFRPLKTATIYGYYEDDTEES